MRRAPLAFIATLAACSNSDRPAPRLDDAAPVVLVDAAPVPVPVPIEADGGTTPTPAPVGPDAASPGAAPSAAAPLLPLLAQFTAPDVPARGPKESPPTPRSWMAPAMPPMHPGRGLAQHPMLYAGEGF